MLLIGGYLMTDKSNNLMSLRWLPLLRDFTECRTFLWGSAVLAWTYQSLSLTAQQGVTDIAGCTSLLVGLPQQSRDQHEARVLRWRVSLDQLYFDEALCPPWFCEEKEWGTWLSAVSLLCFNIIDFHHVDRVKQQFNGEQQVPGTLHQRFELGRRITVQHTFDMRPTLKYYNWWRGACRVRHLSGQEVLEDSRLAKLPPDVQPTAS
ncbi:hypothetical protein Ahy_A03g011435 [Arachis hypogaea]|uniref:Aminotransferase-like plant mobile domain-containing protein n=1 Tax=Arachis hypogaea TaxID=3818 RepID=A0A445DQR2_ARAHY|nr:hypothetical protein Ahy_A03g011435 [Arachis hypogaea]